MESWILHLRLYGKKLYCEKQNETIIYKDTIKKNAARRSVKNTDHLRLCVNLCSSVIYKQMTYEA